MIDERDTEKLEDGIVIQEGVIPGAIGDLLPAGLTAAAKATGEDTDTGFIDESKEALRGLESIVRGPYHGAVNNTQTYLVMAHEQTRGRIRLENDRPRIDWPGVGQEPIFEKISGRLKELTAALGGTYFPNPTWSDLFNKSLTTVHPLGGCIMAEGADGGVVNHKCQVFSGKSGTAVYDSLYACDGQRSSHQPRRESSVDDQHLG